MRLAAAYALAALALAACGTGDSSDRTQSAADSAAPPAASTASADSAPLPADVPIQLPPTPDGRPDPASIEVRQVNTQKYADCMAQTSDPLISSEQARADMQRACKRLPDAPK